MSTSKATRALLAAAVTLALFGARASSGAAAAPANAKTSPDPVIAKGDGFDIKKSKLEDAFVNYKAGLAAKGDTVPESERTTTQAKLLQNLIIGEVLKARATAEDKTKANEEATNYIAQLKARFPSEAMFESQVKASGMTLDEFRARAMDDAIASVVVEREAISKITISDDAVKKLYDEDPDKQLVQPDQVRVAHLLLMTVDEAQKPLPADVKRQKEKQIRELKARAEKGESFTALVKQYSEDPGSKDTGGEYTFAKNHQMVPEFESAAFSLQKTNQISDVVETQYGYHIIKLLEKIPGGKVEFAKVAPQIKDYLTQKEFTNRRPAYFDKIKADAHVQILDKSLILPDAPATPDKK